MQFEPICFCAHSTPNENISSVRCSWDSKQTKSILNSSPVSIFVQPLERRSARVSCVHWLRRPPHWPMLVFPFLGRVKDGLLLHHARSVCDPLHRLHFSFRHVETASYVSKPQVCLKEKYRRCTNLAARKSFSKKLIPSHQRVRAARWLWIGLITVSRGV